MKENYKNLYAMKEDNEYYTFRKDVKNFLDNVSIPKDKIIWCPFDTDNSAFVSVLKENGYQVINTHIDNGEDFYLYEPLEHYDIILSNPPFNGKSKTLKRLIELNKPFGMIYGIQCFNSGGFVRELNNVKNIQMLFLCKRIKYHKGIEDDKLPSPTFHSMWICNDLLDTKIKIIE